MPTGRTLSKEDCGTPASGQPIHARKPGLRGKAKIERVHGVSGGEALLSGAAR